jgi:hypothetical protein
MLGEGNLSCSCVPTFSGRYGGQPVRAKCNPFLLYTSLWSLWSARTETEKTLRCRMPITVYMYTGSSDGPRIIAEYGQEYGKDDPVRVLYDGYGHYDALQPSLVRTQSSRL